MRTLQEKYNAVLEGKFSKTQFRRDAAIEMPQFVSNVNSFDDTVAILKNKGIVTEAFGDKIEDFNDISYQANQGLEVKSLAKQLYLGFKKMGARVRFDANRKKAPMGAEWGEKGLDQIDVLIWVGDSHKGFMAAVDLIGDKAMSFADKIMNDPKFSKFEFNKREIKTWGNQKGIELNVTPKVSRKGAVSVTEAKAQEPKYSTAKPADTIAPDVLDTGIKFELDKKHGTLDVTPEQYAKCREMAIKNLSKDVLYYVKQDSIQLDEPGEKMEKAKLKEGFLDRFKKKPAQSSPAPAKVLSADEIQAMIDAEAKTGTIGDILDAAVVQQTIDLRNATPEQIKTLVSVAREADSGEDTITGDNSMSYLEKLPNFTNDANEATSKEEAWKKFQEKNNVTDKTAKVAREDFEKEWAKRTDEAIQNIENDDHTKRRIAGLVNDFLQRYRDIPEVGAYAAQVKNNLEDGDPSTLKKYKSIMDEKDLIADLEAVTGVNFDTAVEDAEYEAGWNADDLNDLDENQIMDLPMTTAGYSTGETYNIDGIGTVKIISQVQGDDIPAAYGRFKVQKLREEDLSEPDAEDLYPHDDEYLATLKQRKALKEMFKKIITKVIND